MKSAMDVRIAIDNGAAIPAPTPLIDISGLDKRYTTRTGEEVHALSDINLAIANLEFVSVVGPSGCGKTTLLRILAGLEPRSSGAVSIDSSAVSGPRDDVAVVFQQAILLPWNTVLRNVLLPADLRGDKSEKTIRRACDLLRTDMQPKTVIGVARAIAKGFDFTMANPAAAVQITWKMYPEVKPPGRNQYL